METTIPWYKLPYQKFNGFISSPVLKHYYGDIIIVYLTPNNRLYTRAVNCNYGKVAIKKYSIDVVLAFALIPKFDKEDFEVID